jgi:ParB family transcriptional regulator, chromosome partitioning protein
MGQSAQQLAKPKKGVGRKALGRGLSALISTETIAVITRNEEAPKEIVQATGSTVEHKSASFIGMDRLVQNPKQPRHHFGDAEIRELASSITEYGLIQPILVRPRGDLFEIVAGERRWRAAQQAGLKEVPVLIRELTDQETLKIALVENVQREQLNPIEEALGYKQLITEFQLTQEQIAESVGKSRAVVANALRLLKLPDDVIDLLKASELSVGHAKVLLSLKESATQSNFAIRAIRQNLSVRELEELVSKAVILDSGTTKPASKRQMVPHEDAPGFIQESMTRLRNALGTRVVVRHKETGRGKIEIEYYSEQELDRLLENICKD